MNLAIKWRLLNQSIWNDDNAFLVDGIDGGLAIKTDRGYVTTDRNGTTRYSPTIGPWEGHYKLDDNLPVLRIKPSVVTYVLEIVER